MELRQGQGGFLVRLDLHPRDQPHIGRMDRDDGANQGKQYIMVRSSDIVMADAWLGTGTITYVDMGTGTYTVANGQ